MKQETATTWWLTGPPDVGKTTLAQALAAALRKGGEPTCVIHAVMAMVSPAASTRTYESIGTECHRVIHVSTPLEVCEQRNPKDLDARARAKQLTQMTDIHAGYEPPLSPALRVDTCQTALPAAVQQMLRA